MIVWFDRVVYTCPVDISDGMIVWFDRVVYTCPVDMSDGMIGMISWS